MKRRPLSFGFLASILPAALMACGGAASSDGTDPSGTVAAAPRPEPSASTELKIATVVPMATPGSEPQTLLGRSYLNQALSGTGQLLMGAEVPEAESEGDTGEVWHEAVLIDTLVDFQARTGTTSFQGFIDAYNASSYDPVHPFLAIQNPYNDDDMWWALAEVRAANTLKDNSWLTPAVNVFQHVCAQWNSVSTCGGGLPQAMPGNGTNSSYLNAITNQLFFELAMQLYKEYPNAANVCSGQQPWTADANAPRAPYPQESGGLVNSFTNDYLGWALAEYEWFKAHYWPYGSGLLLADGITPSQSCAPSGTTWTYNQGPILGALLDLSQVPPSTLTAHYENDAPATTLNYGFGIAQSAIATFVQPGATSSTSVLTELNDVKGSPLANAGNGDDVEFKGIFARYLARFVAGAAPSWGAYANTSYSFTPTAMAFLDRSAASIWANSNGGASAPPVWFESGVTPSQWSTMTTVTSAAGGLVADIGLVGAPQPTPPPPPAPPSCAYAIETWSTTSFGRPAVSCTPDAQNDPISIYQLGAGGAWTWIANYTNNGLANYLGSGPAGTTATYLACAYDSYYFAGLAAPIGPGATGCDAAAQSVQFPGSLLVTIAEGLAPAAYTLYSPGTIGIPVEVEGVANQLVAMTVSGLPAGVTAQWSPTAEISPKYLSDPAIPTNTVLLLTGVSSAPTSTVALTVTGTVGTSPYSVQVPLVVTPAPACPSGEEWTASADGCTVVTVCNAECECKARGGIWNGTTCGATCTTAACRCTAGGGTWNGKVCI